jgi:hypothetical protein
MRFPQAGGRSFLVARSSTGGSRACGHGGENEEQKDLLRKESGSGNPPRPSQEVDWQSVVSASSGITSSNEKNGREASVVSVLFYQEFDNECEACEPALSGAAASQREVAARHQTLAEASAWVRLIEALASPQVQAVLRRKSARACRAASSASSIAAAGCPHRR